MLLAETYTQLMGNLPHWEFEVTGMIIEAVVVTLPARWLIRRHDRKKHTVPEVDMTELTIEALHTRAGRGDIRAMQELACRHDPDWEASFRQACIDVLGEDPELDWR